MASLAMLFQNRLDPGLTGDRLVAQMLTDFPGLNPTALSAGAPPADDAPVTITYGETLVALLSVPVPVGDDTGGDLAEIAQFSRLWPDTEPAPTEYGAHTIVTVLRPEDDPASSGFAHTDAISDAVLLSQVIASAVALSDEIVAVYFGSANHVVLPAVFRDIALETLPEPMLPAWVALNVAPRQDGIMTAHTRGLDMLGLMDVEIPQSHESAEDSFGRIVNTAIYLLENGPVIGDGDTIGETDTAEVVAHHGPSAVVADKTVLTMEFVGDEFPEVVEETDALKDVPAPKKRRWFGRK